MKKLASFIEIDKHFFDQFEKDYEKITRKIIERIG